MSFTPGPWKIERFGSPRILATDGKGDFPVCDIRGWGHFTGKGHGALGLPEVTAAEIQDANAQLISAAPELFAALKALELQALQSDVNSPANEWGRDALAQARAALSKAQGQPSVSGGEEG